MATPAVFSTKSIGDETRLGMESCKSSIARLTEAPKAIARKIRSPSAIPSPIPNGTKTTILPTNPITRAGDMPNPHAPAEMGCNSSATWGLGRNAIQASQAVESVASPQPNAAKRRRVASNHAPMAALTASSVGSITGG